MLYLTIIVANVLSLFFQIYYIKGVENKHSLFLSLDSIFEIGQPIINVKRLPGFSSNNYVMKHNGAILYQLYLHVGILRK